MSKRILGVMSPNSLTDKVIGLDLDECLISISAQDTDDLKQKILSDPKYMELRHRVFEIKFHDVFTSKGKGVRDDYWGIMRPHLDTFLLFCFSYFRIVFVWSAGKKEYVHAVVDKLFSTLPYPYLVMTHDDIHHLPDGNYYKGLRAVYDIDPVNIRPDNTYFLDNKWDNFIDNPDNGVSIPDYKPKSNINAMMVDDIALLQFRDWLNKPEVISAKDVRKLDKSKIFTTPLSKKAYSKKDDFIMAPPGPIFRQTLNTYGLPDSRLIEVVA